MMCTGVQQQQDTNCSLLSCATTGIVAESERDKFRVAGVAESIKQAIIGGMYSYERSCSISAQKIAGKQAKKLADNTMHPRTGA